MGDKDKIYVELFNFDEQEIYRAGLQGHGEAPEEYDMPDNLARIVSIKKLMAIIYSIHEPGKENMHGAIVVTYGPRIRCIMPNGTKASTMIIFQGFVSQLKCPKQDIAIASGHVGAL